MTKSFLSRNEVRAFDKHAIEALGIPSAVLMENAGRGAGLCLESLGIRGPVVICCGKGNNGGDGLVIARHLSNRGFDTQTLLFANPDELSSDAARQWQLATRMKLHTEIVATNSLDEARLIARFQRAGWIVDALFGTGLTGAVRAPLDRIIDLMNGSKTRVFAIDIPSGLDCDTGEPLGPTIRAEHTATFVAPKLGYANPGSLAYTGIVHVVDIGVPPGR